MIPLVITFILLIALGGMWGLASYEGAHAQALQAQALITANQTTQVSVIGQTVLSVVLAGLVLLILFGVAVWLFQTRIKQNQHVQVRQGWQSGPNARWQKSGQFAGSTDPALEMSPQALLVQQQMMQQQILTLWMMRQMGQPSEMAALPVATALREPQTLNIQSGPPWWE